MKNKTIVTRGKKIEAPKLEEGRLAFATDTKELLIGSDAGNQVYQNKTTIDAQLGEKANETSVASRLADKLDIMNPVAQDGLTVTSTGYTQSSVKSTGATFNSFLQFQINPTDVYIQVKNKYTDIVTLSIRFDVSNELVIMKSAAVVPAIDNVTALGRSYLRFKDIYAGTGTINTSDLFMKKFIKSLNDIKVLSFIMDLDPVEYTFNDGMRTHFGLISQQVEWAMRKNGMGTLDFAGLIISPVYEEFETGESTEEASTDESGKEIITKVPIMKKEIIGETYGLRYDEFIAPLIKMVQIQQKEIESLKDENADIKKRLETLEKLFISQ